jgi:hypothetical protein
MQHGGEAAATKVGARSYHERRMSSSESLLLRRDEVAVPDE